MTIIQQGDEYSLPIKIKQGSSYITATDVDDVRIQVGDVLKTYSKSEITFDSQTSEWLYPLTEEQTRALQDTLTQIQVGIKDGTEIRYSPTMTVMVGQSIIKKEW